MDGKEAANEKFVIGRYFAGLLFHVLALLAACLRSPEAPESVPRDYEDTDNAAIFQRAFVKRLKVRQIIATLFGALTTGSFIGFMLVRDYFFLLFLTL